MVITLEQGAGSQASSDLIDNFRKYFKVQGDWKYQDDDGAVIEIGGEKVVFTTDGFIITPIFFPGGDIGKIAACGTINDLSAMGAKPLGLSLSIVMEEGFPEEDLERIIKSIGKISDETGVPVVTGDTKVIDKGKLDKIEITTSGIGIAKYILSSDNIKVGDDIITSADLGEHGATILAERFGYESDLKSDCHPFCAEVEEIAPYIHALKDPTRGGSGANLNEMAHKSKVKIVLDEEKLPFKQSVISLSELLGIDLFGFPSEGRFVASCAPENTEKVLGILHKYNPEAKIIGKAEVGEGVYVLTKIGSMKRVEMPEGKLLPRIC